MTEKPLDFVGHLAACYREFHNMGPRGARAAFATALKADAAMAKEAAHRLADIDALAAVTGDEKLKDRDHLSFVQREIIRAALAAQ